jgi:uncharacterized small protein (DUF1192 family)
MRDYITTDELVAQVERLQEEVARLAAENERLRASQPQPQKRK